MLEDWLIEGAAGLRVGGKAVPDHLVAEQVAAFDVRMGTQDFIGDLSQLGVGLIARIASI